MKYLQLLKNRFKERFEGSNAWRAWLALILLCTLIGYIFYSTFLKRPLEIDIISLIQEISPFDIIISILLYGLTLVFAIMGWSSIIGRLSNNWNIFEHARIYSVTSLARRLPGSFWYVVGRVFLYERLGISRGLTILGGGLEFMATVLGGIVVILITSPVLLINLSINPYFISIPILLSLLLLNPWVIRRLMQSVHKSPEAPAIRYRHVLSWVLIFAIIWGIGGVLLFTISNTIVPLGLHQIPIVIGIWATAGVASTLLFSFLPFGLGATEVTIAALLSSITPTAEALVIAIVMRILLTLCELGYGALSSLFYWEELIGRSKRKIREQKATSHQNEQKPLEVESPNPLIPAKDPEDNPHGLLH